MDTSALIEFARDLIRSPSLSGEEARVAQRVREEMQLLGYDAVQTDANGSVVGIINGAAPGNTLLFDAHIDTVGVGATSDWQHDPFAAAVVDDKLYGRGSADMKGALAAMVHGIASVPRATIHGRIAVSASTLEEVLEGVTLRTIMDAVDPDVVVIGEATDLHLAHGGRGRAEIRVQTLGRPAHSSSPDLGHNAVLDMAHVVQAVEGIMLPTDPLLGPALLALTDIISDPYPGHSVIPSRCSATYDRRLLPGETVASVLAPFSALFADAMPRPVLELTAAIVEGSHRAYTT